MAFPRKLFSTGGFPPGRSFLGVPPPSVREWISGNVPPSPVLPYDYEVAYIERDCGVPWVDAGGAEIVGYFDLSRYSDSGETLGTMRPLEATWSFEPLSAGYAWAVYRQTGLLQRGAMKTSNRTVYSFFNAIGGHTSTEGNLEVFHTQRCIYEDGHVKGYVDGVLEVD